LDDLIVGAFQASPSSKSNAGKSYVVFGKADNTAINLSAITSGTGGFVITNNQIIQAIAVDIACVGN
jgi:hypothetical protein